MTRSRGRAAIATITLLAACAAACSDNPVEPIAPVIVANDFYPTWSPVADSIAFIRAQATLDGPAGIYVVGSDGGTPRLVAAGEFHELRFSPDGQLVTTAVDGNLITIVVATDERALLLTSSLGVLAPDWSPDGTRIVYSRGDPGAGQPADSAGLHVYDLTSGVDVAMRDSLDAIVVGAQPVWSPEDSLIAFYRDGKIELWNARTHAISRMLTPPAGYTAANPVWIEGGRRLLAAEGGPSFRTVVVEVDTRQVTGWPIYTGPLRAIAPEDSAFVFRDLDPAVASPPTYVLFRRALTDVAGTSIRQLTYHRPNLPNALGVIP